MQSFVKTKNHRRWKNKRYRRKVKEFDPGRMVYMDKEVTIPPHMCQKVVIKGAFEGGDDWLIKRAIISREGESYAIVPNTLVKCSDPQIPISNTSDNLIMLRLGEVVSSRMVAMDYFDKSESELEKGQYERTADFIRKLAEARNVEGEELIEEESYGPKMAAMPKNEEIPLERMRDIIDVGDLPEHLAG
ncbi:uncharacterized protein ARMOST_11671 [Armillaria ostoyae]|uniref:Uncharacterized protein n=1 Tax=Armillaria ostoyae TaxID=47428 RepID=A0A284RHS0_ARMOS|nr:uncharacterized protein ARMOST_11671 [Armillaria ostoyae]